MSAGNLGYVLYQFFTQSFFIGKAPLTEHNLPDQTNRVFLITGGYGGVGYEVASILYSKNGTVWLAGRSESKAAAAVERLQAQHPESSGKLHFLKVDFSDLTTIKPAANDFLRRNETGKLHWLNNNAGVMAPPPGSKGAQGHDLQLVTNIYGPFLFTKLLTPILRQTAHAEKPTSEHGDTPVRVSWAGSTATYAGRPRNGVAWTANESDLFGAFDAPAAAYCTTKAANWYLAVEFGRRFGNQDGVLHNAYNPGNLASGLQRHLAASFHALLTATLNSIFLHPTIQGAYTELYAGLSHDISLRNKDDQGGWIVPWGRKVVMRADMLTESRREGEDAVGQRLWRWWEGIVGEFA